jgi:citrate synthase
MTAGMAVAVLSVGEYTLAPEDAGAFIVDSYARYKESGKSMREAAEELVAELTARRGRVPGFGHPEFKFTDPRAQNLRRKAVEEDVWGEACDWYEAVHHAFVSAIERPQIPINEVGMMAAILVEMGFMPAEMTGIALISSMPGVVAHVSEEISGGKRMRIIPDDTAEYPRRRRDLAADLATKGWTTAEGDGG